MLQQFQEAQPLVHKIMKRLKANQGFTLLELLIVTTIIILLASVVIFYLSDARGRGANTGVKTAFGQLRNEGNIYFNNNGNYGTVQVTGSCFTAGTIFVDPRFAQILASAQSSAGGTITCRNALGATGSWVVSAPLKYTEGGNNYMCADSNGVLKTHSNPLTSGATCP